MEKKKGVGYLADLTIAHMCAVECDNCPSPDEADRMMEDVIKPQTYLKVTKKRLVKVLDRYEGWSPGDLESAVWEELKKTIWPS